VAGASGAAGVRTCEPSCGEGEARSYPVELTASGLRTCPDGTRRYTRVTFAFPEGTPLPPQNAAARRTVAGFPCAGPAGVAVREGDRPAMAKEEAERPARGTEDEIDSGERDAGDQADSGFTGQLEAGVTRSVATETGQPASEIEDMDCDEVEPSLYRCKYRLKGFRSSVEVEVEPGNPSSFTVLPNQ
jgi:hypothetical protein